MGFLSRLKEVVGKTPRDGDGLLDTAVYNKMIQERAEWKKTHNYWKHNASPPLIHAASAADLAEDRQQSSMEPAANGGSPFAYATGELLKQVFSVWDGIIPNEHKMHFVSSIHTTFTRSDSTFSFIAQLKFDMPGVVTPIELHISFKDDQIHARNIPDMRRDIEEWLIKARMMKEIQDNKNAQVA